MFLLLNNYSCQVVYKDMNHLCNHKLPNNYNLTGDIDIHLQQYKYILYRYNLYRLLYRIHILVYLDNYMYRHHMYNYQFRIYNLFHHQEDKHKCSMCSHNFQISDMYMYLQGKHRFLQ